jgi:hypothetical protein
VNVDSPPNEPILVNHNRLGVRSYSQLKRLEISFHMAVTALCWALKLFALCFQMASCTEIGGAVQNLLHGRVSGLVETLCSTSYAFHQESLEGC